MVFWDDLGFATNYTVDADPEYPGDGEWGMPIVPLVGGPTLPTPAPIAIIRPADGEPWVLSAGFYGVGALYGFPSPDHLCIVEQFDRVVLVDVRTGTQSPMDVPSPVRVAASVEFDLLLVAEPRSITALGTDGTRWRSAELGVDDLHITRSDGDRIYYRGIDSSGRETRGSIDALTGL